MGSALAFDNTALRVICNGVVLLMVMGLMYNDGARMGESDTAFAEIAMNRKNEGKNVPGSELDRCFHPLKGFVTAACGAAPVFIIALIYAFMAQKQTYSLGVLPSWVSAYEEHADIGAALAYYHQTSAVQLADVLRVAVRLLLFPFVNIAGANNADALLLVVGCRPCFVCLPLPAMAWDICAGPRCAPWCTGNIRQNKRKHNAKERKAREQRAKQMEQKNKKKELI